MKGLAAWPSVSELAGAYASLQGGDRVAEADLALYAQWTRLDPRLAEIWAARYLRDWESLNPSRLREALLVQPWPQAFGAIVEQCLRYGKIPREKRGFFRSLSRSVLVGIPPAANENFFVSQAPLGGRSLLLDAERCDPTFAKWGYFGRDVFFNKADAILREKTSLPARARRRLLREFVANRERFTSEDYREFLDFRISVRIAQLDLENCPLIRPSGNTKAREYRRRRKQSVPRHRPKVRLK